MPQPPAKQFSGIFVSYRRDDSSGHAGRLSDRLVEHFGRDRIFMDIDTIEPGEDFVTVIENAVGSCEVLIAIIGRNWLSSPGGTTGRLDNPNDFVRLEIATALSRDVRVIPVLVQKASMPKPQDLPEDLAKFVRRNAVELTDLHWQSDVDQLISVMERVLAKREEAARLAEAASETEEEGQSREEQEKQRGAEERVRLEEEEAKRRAAEERRREEEEIERRAAEERASLEAHQESSRRRAEEERVRADADAEARRRELSLAAGQRQLDQPSTASTTGAVSPAFKNKRVVLIAVASLVVLLVVAAVIWLPRGHRDSGNANQAAVAQPSAVTQPSTTKPSETPARAKPTPKAGEVVQNQMGIELVYVPAGQFMMGANSIGAMTQPMHLVTLRNGFYIGKYEVTQAQWKSVMGTNPSRFKGNRLPVEQVSWFDATEFVRKLNEMNDGYAYRLPTEAEWEYACRAGSPGDYLGNIDEVAWYGNNSGRAPLDATDIWQNDHANYFKRIAENGNQTHPVGTKQPNAFGLFDMQGNVLEWVEDRYHDSYTGAPTDGSAWLSGGDQKQRIPRGRAWYELAPRCAERGPRSPDSGGDGNGARVIAVPRQ